MEDIKNIDKIEKNDETIIEFTPEMQDEFHTKLVKNMGVGVIHGAIKNLSEIISNIVFTPVMGAVDKKKYIQDIANLEIYIALVNKLFKIDEQAIIDTKSDIYSQLLGSTLSENEEQDTSDEKVAENTEK